MCGFGLYHFSDHALIEQFPNVAPVKVLLSISPSIVTLPLALLQPQAASPRWRQVQPVQATPRPAQRRAGQADQPAALQRGGALTAGQAVSAAPQRWLPQGQELLPW